MTDSECREFIGQFYVDIQKWIDDGCKSHDIFMEDSGLCANISIYISKCASAARPKIFVMFESELQRHFGTHLHPFNATIDEFRDEISNYETYKNSVRLEWIAARVKQHKEFAPLEEVFRVWALQSSEIKVGDRVTIHTHPSGDNNMYQKEDSGWNNSWVSQMDQYADGTTLYIVEGITDYGVRLANIDYKYPVASLRKV